MLLNNHNRKATREIEKHLQVLNGTCEGIYSDIICSLERHLNILNRNIHKIAIDAEKALSIFNIELGPILEINKKEIILRFKDIIYPRPSIDSLNILGIARTEETYTQFLAWLLDPKSEHGLKEKPLRLFLNSVLSKSDKSKYKLDIYNIDIKAEHGEGGKIPDLQIIGSNFVCIVEIKIASREGIDQTRKYFKTFKHKPEWASKLKYFIYLTLKGEPANQPGDGKTGFKPIKWDYIIQKVLLPIFSKSRGTLKQIYASVIFHLRMNRIYRNTELKEFIERQNIYKSSFFKLSAMLSELEAITKEVTHA